MQALERGKTPTDSDTIGARLAVDHTAKVGSHDYNGALYTLPEIPEPCRLTTSAQIPPEQASRDSSLSVQHRYRPELGGVVRLPDERQLASWEGVGIHQWNTHGSVEQRPQSPSAPVEIVFDHMNGGDAELPGSRELYPVYPNWGYYLTPSEPSSPNPPPMPVKNNFTHDFESYPRHVPFLMDSVPSPAQSPGDSRDHGENEQQPRATASRPYQSELVPDYRVLDEKDEKIVPHLTEVLRSKKMLPLTKPRDCEVYYDENDTKAEKELERAWPLPQTMRVIRLHGDALSAYDWFYEEKNTSLQNIKAVWGKKGKSKVVVRARVPLSFWISSLYPGVRNRGASQPKSPQPSSPSPRCDSLQ